jgi:hypothetical protein
MTTDPLVLEPYQIINLETLMTDTLTAPRAPVYEGLHAMIDLETFGVGERAAVIQLGICAFDPHAQTGGELPEGASPEWNVSLVSSVFLGGEIDPDTVDWWMKRPKLTQEAVEGSAWSMRHVLESTATFLKRYNIEKVWCHGATFDAPILQGYYRRAGMKCPWDYWAVRDTRTFFETVNAVCGWERPKRDTAHTARADAIAQADDVQQAYAALDELLTRVRGS